MIGTAKGMLLLASGNWPKVYEYTPHPGRSLADAFEERVAELTTEFGEPRRETHLDWYPHAADAACWTHGEKTLVLIREHDGRCGARILLCCVADGERATLAGAERTRAARVADAAAFESDFDRRMTALAEPNFGRYLLRKQIVDDLAVIPDRADALLSRKLADPDGEVRCHAVEIALELGGARSLPHVVPLLDDPEHWVRQHVIGCMSHYGDDTVVDLLLAKLRSDPDPGVRGEAAYSLGHIDSPRAIPGLLHALDHDNESDELGHTPSSTSATALDNILGTHETRINHGDGLCSLAPWPPDYALLKARAAELYARWKAGE